MVRATSDLGFEVLDPVTDDPGRAAVVQFLGFGPADPLPARGDATAASQATAS